MCVCVFCWLPVYPLIRDRCGPLGSHQESKKLSLSPTLLPRHCTTPPVPASVLPSRATLHTDARGKGKEQEEEGRACSRKAEAAEEKMHREARAAERKEQGRL